MSSAPPEEERFNRNVLDLSDLVHELTTICWDEGCKDVNPVLIIGAKLFISSYDKIELIETFITYSWEFWEEVKERNENFFLEHASAIFEHLPVDKGNIGAFKLLFTAEDRDGTYIIDQEDRDAVWDMFDSLVKICIKYVHRVRDMKLLDTGSGMKPIYVNKKFYEIKNIRKLAKEWDIELLIPEV